MAGAIVWKQIKLKRFNDDAFKREIRNAALRVQRGMVSEYKKATKTWAHQPQFIGTRDLSHDPVTILVGTNDRVFNLLDSGTRQDGYFIFPVQAYQLSYQSDFVPKTVPGWLGSRSGGKSGGWTHRQWVTHPGVEAREFSEKVAEIWQKKIRSEMEEVMRNFAKQSGHSA